MHRAGRARAITVAADAAETNLKLQIMLASGFMLSTLLALLLISP